jgi:hypothetical protein
MNFAKYATRWFRLYSGLLGSGYKMLPVIYEGKDHTIFVDFI